MLGLIVLVLVSLFGLFRYYYPCGPRPACLPVLLEALRSYSIDHDRAFPAGTEPLEALRALYPYYLPHCEPLAGLSGNRSKLKKDILEGHKIDEVASSWVYCPGLRTDDNPE